MNEAESKNTNKKATPPEAETIKVSRDKNGRFISKNGNQDKKPEDGNVKINVVKDKDKKPTGKQSVQEDESINAVRSSAFNAEMMSRIIDGNLLRNFIAHVTNNKPRTITINGCTYYSDEEVAHRIQQTISTCAEAASKEMEKLDALKKFQEQHQSEIHSGEKGTIAQKMAVWSANFVLWSFVFAVGIFATLGIVELPRHFFS